MTPQPLHDPTLTSRHFREQYRRLAARRQSLARRNASPGPGSAYKYTNFFRCTRRSLSARQTLAPPKCARSHEKRKRARASGGGHFSCVCANSCFPRVFCPVQTRGSRVKWPRRRLPCRRAALDRTRLARARKNRSLPGIGGGSFHPRGSRHDIVKSAPSASMICENCPGDGFIPAAGAAPSRIGRFLRRLPRCDACALCKWRDA